MTKEKMFKLCSYFQVLREPSTGINAESPVVMGTRWNAFEAHRPFIWHPWFGRYLKMFLFAELQLPMLYILIENFLCFVSGFKQVLYPLFTPLFPLLIAPQCISFPLLVCIDLPLPWHCFSTSFTVNLGEWAHPIECWI